MNQSREDVENELAPIRYQRAQPRVVYDERLTSAARELPATLSGRADPEQGPGVSVRTGRSVGRCDIR